MHEWSITGHGPVSVTLGFLHSTVYGALGAAMAATRICWSGNGFSDRICARSVASGVSMPAPSADTQPSSVTTSFTLPVGARRGGFAPLQRCPNSLQRKLVTGPSGEARFWLLIVSKRALPGGTEQSSSSVSSTMNSRASGRRKPWFSAGMGRPSAPSARATAASGCSKPQPLLPTAAMQVNTSSMLPA